MNARFAPEIDIVASVRRHGEMMDIINDVASSPAQADAAYAEQVALERRIVKRRASAHDEVQAKARLVRALITGTTVAASAPPNTFCDDVGRAIWSLLDDLDRGSAATIKPPIMPLDQMLPLFDALGTLRQVAVALCCQPRFTNADGLYNEAGGFLEKIGGLIGKAGDCIAERADAIQLDECKKGYSDDFADRAEILITHEISCEGIASAATLAAELYGPRPQVEARS